MDKSVFFGIHRFLLWPNCYDQGKINLFLEACRNILKISRRNHFGVPEYKSVGADEVVQYYMTVIVPQLKTFLAPSPLSAHQLDHAAIHITSIACAISQEMSQGRWPDEQLDKVNGLTQICMVLAQEICQKKDDSDHYYQFTELYREPVQRYTNVTPSNQLLLDSIAAREVGMFSPRDMTQAPIIHSDYSSIFFQRHGI